jgi:hypothetical protein
MQMSLFIPIHNGHFRSCANDPSNLISLAIIIPEGSPKYSIEDRRNPYHPLPIR